MPRQVDHGRRRDEIAQMVWQIIAEQGLGAVTLRSIAARGDISVGRVQHYFPTRDAIVLYGLQAMIERAADSFRHATRDDDPRTALIALMVHSIPRTAERRLGSKVWYAYVAESVASQSIANLLRDTLQGVEDLTTTLIAAARGSVENPVAGDRAKARMLTAAADGLTYRVLVGQLSDRQAEHVMHDLIGVALAVGEIAT